MKKTIWIAAGGTGGHISPAVALFEEFKQKGFRVIFFTLPKNENYPDIIYLKESDDAEVITYQAPLIPSNPLKLFVFIRDMFSCFLQLRKTRRLAPPSAVIGMGGYPSFPAVLFARLKRLPYYLCEQNSNHGMITRLMSKKAELVFHSFPPEKKHGNELYSGNPLRRLFRVANGTFNLRRVSYPLRTVLIFGGSQGSNDLNRLYLHMKEDKAFRNIKFILVSGIREFTTIISESREHDEVYDFVQDMPSLLNRADFVICRAGSGTLFELVWSGRPALLIPFPHATDDHQYYNALYLEEKNCVLIANERPFDLFEATEKVLRIVKSEEMFKEMAANMRKNPPLKLDAHRTIPDTIIEDIK